MIYKILKHSLPCLCACQEYHSVCILRVLELLLSPLQSCTGAALTTENTQKPASAHEMLISLYPSKHQGDFIHSEMV